MSSLTENAQRDAACCEPEVDYPEISNRPGQDKLSYRLGTHAAFLRHMLAHLHLQKTPSGDNKGKLPLQNLTTRDPDDPSIAVLDAWATAADVITFYQERIANEGFLRTAGERRSVLELARAISYELSPGVAAGTFVAFTVDESKQTPSEVIIPTGIQIQSIPRTKDKQPQIFETMADFTAHVEWNELKPRRVKPFEWSISNETEIGITKLYLKGVETNLQPGDPILIVGDKRTNAKDLKSWAIRTIDTVTPDPEDSYTLVTWKEQLKYENGHIIDPADNPKVFAFRQRAALFGYNAPGQPTAAPTEDLQGVWGSSASDVFAVGGGGTILRYDGKKWTTMTSGTTKDLFGVWGSSASDVFAVGRSGTILHYDGKKWTTMTNPSQTPKDLFGIWGSSGANVFAVGGGMILHYDGKNWTTMPIWTTHDLFSLWGSSGANVFVVGGGGTILRYDGKNWTTMANWTINDLLGIWGSSGKNVFAVGRCGTILRYDGNAEGTWTTMPSVTKKKLSSVWGSSGENVFAVGDDGTILHYDGKKWTSVTCRTTKNLLGIWGCSENHFFVVGNDGTILHYTKEVYLDAAYPGILEESWVALQDGNGQQQLFRAGKVSVHPHSETFEVVVTTDETKTSSEFTLAAKSTHIEFDTGFDTTEFTRRNTEVLAQSELLEVAEKPITTPIFGNSIVLDGPVSGLIRRQPLIVTGKPVSRVRTAVETLELRILVSGGQITAWQDLNSGETLQIVSPPTRMTVGSEEKIKWHLKNQYGDTGFVTAGPEEIIPVPPDEDEQEVVELAYLDDTLDENEGERTKLILVDALENVYDRKTVKIYANVVRATHGETVKEEILGSGDGSQTNQRFMLKRYPLTFVSAATTSGVQSTLTIRVKGVQWEEQPSLYEQESTSKSYIVRIDNDANATAIFGDGKRGARLPTGSENVVATYRTGIGPDGEVEARSLTLLKTRPLGIREVTNPLPATGAAPPESLDQARDNAPLKVLTLDRVVSLTDYEGYARTFAGIAKAKAVALWDGENYLVHITIAGRGGQTADTELCENLLTAINQVRDPLQEVRLQGFDPCYFNLSARIKIDAAYEGEKIIAEVEEGLKNEFSFDRRQFGQPVTAAEIVSFIQEFKGVIGVDLDKLYLETDGPCQESVLPAENARLEVDTGDVQLAQLLMINPDGITLEEME